MIAEVQIRTQGVSPGFADHYGILTPAATCCANRFGRLCSCALAGAATS